MTRDESAGGSQAERLVELRGKRAADMLGLIEQRAPVELARFGATKVSASGEASTFHAEVRGPDGGSPALRACSARELDWLRPTVALLQRAMVRTDQAPHSKYGITTPYTRSMLIVIYTARYFLSDRSPADGTARDVHVVYGALQATDLPIDRSLPTI